MRPSVPCRGDRCGAFAVATLELSRGRRRAPPASSAAAGHATGRSRHLRQGDRVAVVAGQPVRVAVIVMENHGYDSVVGLPYIHTIASTATALTNYHASGHPSLPNYLALTSGTTWGISDDGYHVLPAQDVGDQLTAAGVAWRAYMEDMGADCRQGNGGYAVKHDPFAYYGGRCQPSVVPFSQLRRRPRRCGAAAVHVDHAQPLQRHARLRAGVGDAWLRRTVPALLASPAMATACVFITWDENDGGGVQPGADAGARRQARGQPGRRVLAPLAAGDRRGPARPAAAARHARRGGHRAPLSPAHRAPAGCTLPRRCDPEPRRQSRARPSPSSPARGGASAAPSRAAWPPRTPSSLSRARRPSWRRRRAGLPSIHPYRADVGAPGRDGRGGGGRGRARPSRRVGQQRRRRSSPQPFADITDEQLARGHGGQPRRRLRRVPRGAAAHGRRRRRRDRQHGVAVGRRRRREVPRQRLVQRLQGGAHRPDRGGGTGGAAARRALRLAEPGGGGHGHAAPCRAPPARRHDPRRRRRLVEFLVSDAAAPLSGTNIPIYSNR